MRRAALPLCLVCALAACAGGDSQETAEAFVERADRELREIGKEYAQASWVQLTYITPDTEVMAAQANEALVTAADPGSKRAGIFEFGRQGGGILDADRVVIGQVGSQIAATGDHHGTVAVAAVVVDGGYAVMAAQAELRYGAGLRRHVGRRRGVVRRLDRKVGTRRVRGVGGDCAQAMVPERQIHGRVVGRLQRVVRGMTEDTDPVKSRCARGLLIGYVVPHPIATGICASCGTRCAEVVFGVFDTLSRCGSRHCRGHHEHPKCKAKQN